MSYNSSDRNQFRIAVAAVSGATAIAAFAATGWLAGAAARGTEAQQAAADQQAQQAQQGNAGRGRGGGDAVTAGTRTHPRPKVVLRQRPQRTHTTVRYVQGTPSAPVGGGGTVSQPVAHGSAPAPQPAPHPAPAPPPAPSSGS